MKKNIFLLIATAMMAAIGLKSQPMPAEPQKKSTLVVGVTAHLGNGQKIENAAIGFDKGKITFVGEARTANRSNFETVIEANGKHAYPSFIAPNTQLGLVEIESVRATRDDYEVGYFNPSVRSLIAYNTDSKVIPTIRSNGVLLAQITPLGGRVSGQSSIVELDGWNWEDAAYRTDEGVWLTWPRYFSWSGWWAEPGSIQMNKNYNEEVKQIKDVFAEAKAYAQGGASEKNLKFEAMRGLFDDSKQLYIRTDFAKTIMEAVNFAKEIGLKVVIVGAEDAWLVTDFLKANDVPLILSQTHRLPSREDEDVDMPFKLPKLLADAGITFALSVGDSWQQRNLAFQAGHAVGFGLDYEAAVAAISLNTAKILGIDKTAGSIEVGKDATFFISQGDALDMRTCIVEQAFIRGKAIDLDNKQKELYRRFKAKYERQ